MDMVVTARGIRTLAWGHFRLTVLSYVRIGYTPRARLLSDLATECRRHEVAKSLGNQARGVQPACTMTTQNSKIRLISSIALKSRLITYLST